MQTADPREVVADQTSGLPAGLGERVAALVSEHESAKTEDATINVIAGFQ